MAKQSNWWSESTFQVHPCVTWWQGCTSFIFTHCTEFVQIKLRQKQVFEKKNSNNTSFLSWFAVTVVMARWTYEEVFRGERGLWGLLTSESPFVESNIPFIPYNTSFSSVAAPVQPELKHFRDWFDQEESPLTVSGLFVHWAQEEGRSLYCKTSFPLMDGCCWGSWQILTLWASIFYVTWFKSAYSHCMLFVCICKC